MSGKEYLHVLFGLLENTEYLKLVECRVMDEMSAPAIAEAIEVVMSGFGVDTENFLLLTSDAAAYMKA